MNGKRKAKISWLNTLDNEGVISGPYIEDGRWIVMVPRKTADAAALLKEKLADGGKTAGVAELIARSISRNLKILVNGEITEVYVENGDFAEFLTDFFQANPFGCHQTMTCNCEYSKKCFLPIALFRLYMRIAKNGGEIYTEISSVKPASGYGKRCALSRG